MPGFDNDLVAYVSMDARPLTSNFFIEDSDGGHTTQAKAHHSTRALEHDYVRWKPVPLIVEATDENGWRDINYFEIDLGAQDMVVYYSPRNETAWTDSTDIEIIEAEHTMGLKFYAWMVDD